MIRECVEAARDAGKNPAHCVGIVADPCIDLVKNKDGYIEQAKACAARELKIWAARLDKSLAILKRSSPAMADAVSQSQKAWSASSGKLCPLYDRLDPGMSLGAADYCRMHETAGRALLLETLELAVSEH